MPAMFQLAGERVYIAGHGRMVGSAIVRRLAWEHCEVLVADPSPAPTRWANMAGTSRAKAETSAPQPFLAYS